jgi:hypothetical protein
VKLSTSNKAALRKELHLLEDHNVSFLDKM